MKDITLNEACGTGNFKLNYTCAPISSGIWNYQADAVEPDRFKRSTVKGDTYVWVGHIRKDTE